MSQQELLNYLESYLTERRRELFKEVLSNRTRHFTVVTEDVKQLHNTSAVIRTCDIFGIQDLHVVEELQGKRIDKEIAMGAQKWVSLHRYSNIEQCMESLKCQGYRIIATTPHKSSVCLEDFDITQKAAFFFGKESDGLSDKVLKQADAFLKIPMYGFTESLNISVTVAIILQQLMTRLRKKDENWKLTKEEQLNLRLDWTKKSIKSIEQIIARYEQQKNH